MYHNAQWISTWTTKNISHVEPEVVKGVLCELKKYFGELTVESGTSFGFLGMNIKIRTDKKIEIEMKG